MSRYVYVTDVETGGQIWRLLFNRLLVSAALFQVVMFGVLSLKSARIASFAVAPLPIVTILFKILCSHRFDHRVYYYQPKIESYYNGENKACLDHDKKTSKSSVGFRFGDPAFFAELPIPMVHESVRHLLPKLYGGGKTSKKPFMSRMTRQKSVRHVSVIKLQNSATGGELQFQSIGEKDLELDDSTEGVKGMYKFNEDEESSNVVEPPRTNDYTNNEPSSNSINLLKRLSNRLSNKLNPNNNDMYSSKRPLVGSSRMDSTEDEDFTSLYHQQQEPKMTQDMEYFVAGQAYRTHNPENLMNSSNAIEMANIYKSQQQPYQPAPSHTMTDSYKQYIRNPVGVYTGHGRAKNYQQDVNYQSNRR